MLNLSKNPLAKIEIGSPFWLIERIQKFSEWIFDRALKVFGGGVGSQLLFLALPVSCLLFLCLKQDLIVKSVWPDFYMIAFLKRAFIVMVVLLAASVTQLLRPKFDNKFYIGLSALTLGAKALVYYRQNALALIAFEMIFYIFTVGLLKLTASLALRRPERKRSSTFLVGGFLGLLLLWWIFGAQVGPEWANVYRNQYLFTPERLLFPLLIFWAEWTNINKEIPLFSQQRMIHLLSPINLILGFPIPFESLNGSPERRIGIRLQGLFDLITALFAAYVYYQLRKKIVVPLADSDNLALKQMAMGFLVYLLLFLKSFWIFRMLTGLGRWIGYDLIDTFNFALLAVNPVDRWRRWGIPFNIWLRDLIFFPAMARSKKIFLPLSWTFFVSFFLHSFSILTLVSLDDFSSQSFFRFRSNLIYYTLQMLVIYLTVKTAGIWPNGERKTGWLGVVATLALMSLIHTFVRIAL